MFRFFAVLLMVGIPTVNTAWAFALVPISRQFSPTGEGRTQLYDVVNNTQETIAVEIRAANRLIDIDGQESLSDAEDDFLIYPPQIILEPGATQTVKVTWLGEPTLQVERAYRLVAEQLPVRLDNVEGLVVDKPTGSIKILFRYLASMYVTPKDAKPRVTVLESGMQGPSDSEEAKLSLVLYNGGNGNARLRDFRLHLTNTNTNTSLVLNAKEAGPLYNALILPDHKRRFVLPWPKDLPRGPIIVRFEDAKQ